MYTQSEKELSWWFAEREAALGFKGSGFEAGSRVVWDDAKIDHEHLRRIAPMGRHRSVMEIEAKIRRTITLLEPEPLAVARASYASAHGTDLLHGHFKREGSTWTLLGVALEQPLAPLTAAEITKTAPFRKALRTLEHGYALTVRAKGFVDRRKVAPQLGTVLDIFELFAAPATEAPEDMKTRIFRPLRSHAESALVAALGRYDELRRERVQRDRLAVETEKARYLAFLAGE